MDEAPDGKPVQQSCWNDKRVRCVVNRERFIALLWGLTLGFLVQRYMPSDAPAVLFMLSVTCFFGLVLQMWKLSCAEGSGDL